MGRITDVKVTFVGAFPPQQKGEAHYLGRYVQEYDRTFGDCTVVSQYTGTPSRDMWNGVAVNRAIEDRSVTGVSYRPQRELVQAVLATNPDIAHLHYGPNPDYGGRLGEMLVPAMRALRRHGVRTVLTLHSLWLPENVREQAASLGLPSTLSPLVETYFRVFQKLLVGSFDRVLCLVSAPESSMTARYAHAYGLRALGEEVHACEPRFGEAFVPNAHGDSEFFAFGFLRPDKGFDVLVEAFGRYVRAGGKGRLTIAGRPQSEADNAYADALQRAAAAVPEQRCVVERRFIADDELERYLQNCDVVVLPYLRNVGASGPLHHALGVGKPILATDAGHTSALRDSVRMVGAGNVEALAGALHELSNPDIQADYAARSRRMATERSWAQLVRRNNAIYGSLLR